MAYLKPIGGHCYVRSALAFNSNHAYPLHYKIVKNIWWRFSISKLEYLNSGDSPSESRTPKENQINQDGTICKQHVAIHMMTYTSTHTCLSSLILF